MNLKKVMCLSISCVNLLSNYVFADPLEKTLKNQNLSKNLCVDIPTNFDGSSNLNNSFFSFISRLRYINRWALFKNQEPEDLADHSAEVAFLAHILSVIKNKKFEGNLKEY